MNTLALIVCLQVAPGGAAPLDEKRVEAAIQKGVKFLRTAPAPSGPGDLPESDELRLWTLLHVGVPEQDVQVQDLLKKAATAPLERTFNVALLAMCLEELDRVKYQALIQKCAQFLVDNQCLNGEWATGDPTDFPFERIPPPAPGPRPRVFNPPPAGKPVVRQKLRVVKGREGPKSGDAESSFFAALGLRACFDSGIVFEKQVLEKAQARWTETALVEKSAEGTELRSWSGSVAGTAAAVSCAAILDYLQGRDWRRNKDVQGGIAWLGLHSKAEGPFTALYGQDRAGMLAGVEKFGDRPWYLPAAKFLLDAQREDGSWGRDERAAANVRDTCFAMLVLYKRRGG